MDMAPPATIANFILAQEMSAVTIASAAAGAETSRPFCLAHDMDVLTDGMYNVNIGGPPTLSTETAKRKLAAIVSIDIAGYSALSERDERAAVTLVETLRSGARGAAEAHGGRIFNTAGDGVMLVFASATDALEAALALMAKSPQARFGVHIGEVLETESGDLLGHGVNVAARLQQTAQTGGALVSEDVQRAVRG